AILLGRGGCEPPEPEWILSSKSASRRQCWVQMDAATAKVMLKDLSRHGTYVNGSLVLRKAILADGDILGLGNPRHSRAQRCEDTSAWRVRIAVEASAMAGRCERDPIRFQIARTAPAGAARQEARQYLSRLALAHTLDEALPLGAPRDEEEPDAEADVSEDVASAAEALARLDLCPVAEPEPSPADPVEQYAILDTNQLLDDNRTAINEILENAPGVNIIVPIAVWKELDDQQKREESAYAAREAVRMVNQWLRSRPRECMASQPSAIRLQQLVETIPDGADREADDEIWACA
ncbi:unnamed protein product, partial [Effrenium voratum]